MSNDDFDYEISVKVRRKLSKIRPKMIAENDEPIIANPLTDKSSVDNNEGILQLQCKCLAKLKPPPMYLKFADTQKCSTNCEKCGRDFLTVLCLNRHMAEHKTMLIPESSDDSD